MNNPNDERPGHRASLLAYRNREISGYPRCALAAHPERISVSSVCISARRKFTTPSCSSARRAPSKWGRMGRYYNEARELARRITEWSDSLHECGAAIRGVQRRRPRHHGSGQSRRAGRGRKNHRASISACRSSSGPNPFITPELCFEFHYFFMRKFWFAYLAKALVVFPGGFGTLDELTEILTLAQTQKLVKKMVVILYGTDVLEGNPQLRRAGAARHDRRKGPGTVQLRRRRRRPPSNCWKPASPSITSSRTRKCRKSPNRECRRPCAPACRRSGRWMGRAGIAFSASLAGVSRAGVFRAAQRIAAGRWIRRACHRHLAGHPAAADGGAHAVWRLRNRLLVTYLFIAVVPIVLIAALAVAGGYAADRPAGRLSGDQRAGPAHRRSALGCAKASCARAPASRPDVMRRMIGSVLQRALSRNRSCCCAMPGKLIRYPADGTMPAPLRGWKRYERRAAARGPVLPLGLRQDRRRAMSRSPLP